MCSAPRNAEVPAKWEKEKGMEKERREKIHGLFRQQPGRASNWWGKIFRATWVVKKQREKREGASVKIASFCNFENTQKLFSSTTRALLGVAQFSSFILSSSLGAFIPDAKTPVSPDFVPLRLEFGSFTCVVEKCSRGGRNTEKISLHCRVRCTPNTVSHPEISLCCYSLENTSRWSSIVWWDRLEREGKIVTDRCIELIKKYINKFFSDAPRSLFCPQSFLSSGRFCCNNISMYLKISGGILFGSVMNTRILGCVINEGWSSR